KKKNKEIDLPTTKPVRRYKFPVNFPELEYGRTFHQEASVPISPSVFRFLLSQQLVGVEDQIFLLLRWSTSALAAAESKLCPRPSFVDAGGSGLFFCQRQRELGKQGNEGLADRFR
ncbi:hypothetical protein Dimus_005438, partial [Dionaea muscipula]